MQARPGRPASDAVRVPRVAVSPPASFPPRLAAAQLPLACGWCHLLHRGLSPSSVLACPAYMKEGLHVVRPLLFLAPCKSMSHDAYGTQGAWTLTLSLKAIVSGASKAIYCQAPMLNCSSKWSVFVSMFSHLDVNVSYFSGSWLAPFRFNNQMIAGSFFIHLFESANHRTTPNKS